MSVLKTERCELEVELSLLNKKQSKSTWYHKKKRASYSSDASSADNTQIVINSPASSSAVPQSSRKHFSPPHSPWSEISHSSCTPSPVSSRLTTPSPNIPRPAVTPRRCFSPVLSASECEGTHDGDTIILSSEDDTSVRDQPLSFVSNPLRLSGGVSQLCTALLSMLKSWKLASLHQVTSIFSKASPAHFAGGGGGLLLTL